VNERDCVVLDSWAVLAWLQGEPSAAVISDLLACTRGDRQAEARAQQATGRRFRAPQLLMNIVNLGEVFYIVGRKRGEHEARQTLQELEGTPLEAVSASDELVLEAAQLKLTYAVAHADAFALATAFAFGGTLATGDPEFKSIPDLPLLWLG